MTLVDALVVLAIFGSFGFLIWSRLVQRDHPIVEKIQTWINKPKDKINEIDKSESWQQPNIERRIY